MNAIQGMGYSQSVAPMKMSGGASSMVSSPKCQGQGCSSQAASITNDQGQSLLDIKGELESAVATAMEDFDGEGDLRTAVEGALNAALEENGFDASEVKAAMDSGGGDMRARMGRGGGGGMQAMMGKGGAGMQARMGRGGGGGMQAMMGRGGGGGGGMQATMGGMQGQEATDLNSLLESSETEEDVVDAFLQQFRAGVNLDVAG